MTTWPNWVDLIIIILIMRMSYNGFGRGLLTEMLQLAGAVAITCLSVNYWGLVKTLQPLTILAPHTAAVVAFWTLFLTLIVVVHAVIRRLTDLIKWERLHWLIQGIGLFFGGARGLWWAGFIVIILSSSGLVPVQQSVEERSVFGPHLLPLSRKTLEEAADHFPGTQYRIAGTLVPPIQPASKK